MYAVLASPYMVSSSLLRQKLSPRRYRAAIAPASINIPIVISVRAKIDFFFFCIVTISVSEQAANLRDTELQPELGAVVVVEDGAECVLLQRVADLPRCDLHLLRSTNGLD